MIAYKFLRAGAVGPFSGLWCPRPVNGRPGAWVQTGDAAAACRRGVHACRAQDLPWWVADDLWEAELSGEIAVYDHKVAAPCGRLLRRIEKWTPELGREYAHECAWRARDRAIAALERTQVRDAAVRLTACATLDELVDVSGQIVAAVPDARISLTMAGDAAARARANAVAVSAYIAAHAAGRIAGEAGAAAERRWQAEWLVAHVGPLTALV